MPENSPFRALPRLLRLGVVGALGALGVAASGCSAPGEAEDVQATEQALDLSAFGPGGWDNWTFQTDLSTDPAVCTNLWGYFMVVGLNPYDQTYYWNIQVPINDDVDLPSWGQVKSATPTFSSAPSCAFEAPFRITSTSSISNKFFLAGKGTDNKIYYLLGHQNNPAVQAPPLPTADSNWTAISNTTYSGNYGRPAVWSSGGTAVMTFLSSDRVIHAYTHGIPLSTSGWSGIINGPALPTGVTSDGIPAITFVRGPSNNVNKFVVLVRGVQSGAPGLYWIYFDGGSFVGSWTKQTLPGTVRVDSDPAAEYDDQSDALSVYFKSTLSDQSTIVQTSVHTPSQIGNASYPFAEVNAHSGDAYDPFQVNAPRVVFGGTSDNLPHGVRTLVTKGYNGNTLPQDEFATIMWIADHHYAPIATASFPYDNVELPFSAVCADKSQEQQNFSHGMVGCSGQVSYANRGTMCAPGSHVCKASEYTTNLGAATPQYNYWVDDNLNHRGGTGTGACFASTSTGTACPAGTAMHVCTTTGSDALGNSCVQYNCGLNSNTPNKYFGGCNGATAGALCCLDVPQP